MDGTSEQELIPLPLGEWDVWVLRMSGKGQGERQESAVLI